MSLKLLCNVGTLQYGDCICTFSIEHNSFSWLVLKLKKFLFYFLYPVLNSYSCGYRKAFEEYVNILGDKYPQILIKGANYDPPGLNYYLSKLIVAVKMLAIIVIVSSFDIWGHIGQAIPNWYRWCVDNKIYACMMIFFVGNMLEAQVSNLENE